MMLWCPRERMRRLGYTPEMLGSLGWTYAGAHIDVAEPAPAPEPEPVIAEEGEDKPPRRKSADVTDG